MARSIVPLTALALVALLLAAAPAHAGRSCEARKPTPQLIERGMQLAQQTAAALGTSQGNVKSQTSRGLDALRAALARRGLDHALEPTAGETP